MPLSLQAKLLRVIENGRVRRIGGRKEYKTNVRIIASTNEKMDDLLNTNKIREDLFYRMSVVNVEIPPLRDRKDDIKVLADHFINDFNSKFSKNIEGIDTKVEKIFLKYSWPGNVREFKNCIEAAFINSADESKIRPEDIPKYILKKTGSAKDYKNLEFKAVNKLSLKENIKELEKHLITAALKETGNNISQAAEKLSISRQSLYNKLEKYGFKLP